MPDNKNKVGNLKLLPKPALNQGSKSFPKNNYKKPNQVKAKKKESSPALAIGIFVVFLIICGLIIFLFVRKIKNSNSPENKTNKPIYLTATEEPEKIKVTESVSASEKNFLPQQKKSFKTHSDSNKTNFNKSSFNKAEKKEPPKPNNFPNKFVSPDREWQPINPGLREATNRFKNLVYGGQPVTIFNLLVLENSCYFSGYSEKRKNPIWVAYRLDAHKGQNKLSRPGKFLTDFRTKSKVNSNVYAKTGYDRGHLCPNSAIAARYGKKGQMETFLMSNICPQRPELNRKVWERLERLEEGYANKFGGIWVITGPIFNQHVELMNYQIEIPDSFYKILIDEDKGRVRVLPFIVPQSVSGKEILNDFLTSVDEIERRTGLDFFSPMDDEYEDRLESYIPGKTMWN